MKKFFKRKIVKVFLAILVIVGIWVAFNTQKALQMVVDMGMALTSNIKHRNPSKEKARFEISADALSKAFKDNIADANKTYINQTVLIEGNVASVAGVTVTLNNIACNVDSAQLQKLQSIKVNDKVKIQGLVVSYNDLMDEVDLAQCTFK